MDKQEALFHFALRLGDNSLIMGQRLAEWCGHAPVIEQDIALSNIALDNVGQARTLLTYAGNLEGKGRTEDDLAFFRDSFQFRNNLLVELPNIHFGHTILKCLFYDQFLMALYSHMQESSDETMASFAVKSLKEVKYHVRYSRDWTLRLGDGTEESHAKMQASLNELWEYTGELFEIDEIDKILIQEKVIPNIESLQKEWNSQVESILKEATLTIPDTKGYMATGGRNGVHTENLDYILAEMQVLPRSMPDATW